MIMAYFPVDATCQSCGRVGDLSSMTGSLVREEFYCRDEKGCEERG